MEIFVLFLIAGLAAFWWVNHTMKKNEERLKEQESSDTAAPYKVEPEVVKEVEKVEVQQSQPEPNKCGCGRSPTGFCVGLHKLTAEEWAVHADNPNKVEPAKEVKRPRKTKPTPVEPVSEPKKTRGRKPSNEKKATSQVKTSKSKKSKSAN